MKKGTPEIETLCSRYKEVARDLMVARLLYVEQPKHVDKGAEDTEEEDDVRGRVLSELSERTSTLKRELLGLEKLLNKSGVDVRILVVPFHPKAFSVELFGNSKQKRNFTQEDGREKVPS